MKLLLTSDGFTTPEIAYEFLELVGKPASDIRLGVVVPNAIESEIELYYYNLHMDIFSQVGLLKQNIQVINLEEKLIYKLLEGMDAIFICGGNTYYILSKMRQFGFNKYVRQYIERGGVYIGESAGSIIAGPNIEVTALCGDINNICLEDLTGLGFIDTAILPHFEEKQNNDVKEFKSRVNYPVVTLSDSQAMLIIDNKEKIIGS